MVNRVLGKVLKVLGKIFKYVFLTWLLVGTWLVGTIIYDKLTKDYKLMYTDHYVEDFLVLDSARLRNLYFYKHKSGNYLRVYDYDSTAQILVWKLTQYDNLTIGDVDVNKTLKIKGTGKSDATYGHLRLPFSTFDVVFSLDNNRADHIEIYFEDGQPIDTARRGANTLCQTVGQNTVKIFNAGFIEESIINKKSNVYAIGFLKAKDGVYLLAYSYYHKATSAKDLLEIIKAE